MATVPLTTHGEVACVTGSEDSVKVTVSGLTTLTFNASTGGLPASVAVRAVHDPTKSEALTGIAAVTLEQQPTSGQVPNALGGLSGVLSHCVMLPENDRPNGF